MCVKSIIFLKKTGIVLRLPSQRLHFFVQVSTKIILNYILNLLQKDFFLSEFGASVLYFLNCKDKLYSSLHIDNIQQAIRKKMESVSASKRSSNPINHILDTSTKNTEINTTCGHSQIIQSPVPRLRQIPKDSYEKQLSVRSYATNNRSHKASRISNMSYLEYQPEYSNLTEDARINYEAIEQILKGENGNLKKQNEMLLSEIYKLKSVNKKYKEACLSQKIELQAVREQCEAQKRRADEMKEIIMNRLMSLEAKVTENGQNHNNFSGESLLEMLNLSESGQQ